MKLTKSELRNIIKEEIQKLNEGGNVFIQGQQLWYSYSPDSGTTTKINSKREYWTDEPGDKKYNHLGVSSIKKWAEFRKPYKKTKYGSMFQIPVYDDIRKTPNKTAKDFSIWGGPVQPKQYRWLVIQPTGFSGKYTIISIFDKRAEALMWLSAK